MKVVVLSVIMLLSCSLLAQNFEDTNGIDVTVFKGNILPHSPNIIHLITGHPSGLMVSFYKKTHGCQQWHALYNFPDYGGYFLTQDLKNETLGTCYAVGAFYNFYFLKNRNLSFKVASGIAMTTNPYDKESNNKNTAFGSKFMGNADFILNYKRENYIDKFGFQAGVIFTHFSSGRIKSPNSGLNTYSFNVGINYNFDNRNQKRDTIQLATTTCTEPIKYNFVLRTGYNESPVIGSGQKPFFHLSLYLDKRITRKSALQLGTELFLTNSIKEYINFRSIAYPEDGIDATTDYKRAALFIGHELFINRISLETQLGYYFYQPFKSELPVYDRLGIKYYFSKNTFTGVSLKTHGFLAEAMEFVMGIRF